MVIPLIFGKIAKDILDGAFFSETVNLIGLLVGFLGALITGNFACKLMIKLVKKSQLKFFRCIVL